MGTIVARSHPCTLIGDTDPYPTEIASFPGNGHLKKERGEARVLFIFHSRGVREEFFCPFLDSDSWIEWEISPILILDLGFEDRSNLPDEIKSLFISCDLNSPTLQYADRGGQALPFSGGSLQIQNDGSCEVDTRIQCS